VVGIFLHLTHEHMFAKIANTEHMFCIKNNVFGYTVI